MKNIKDFINESNQNTIKVSNNKSKFGFMRYNDMANTIDVVSFDNLNELARQEGFDEDDYLDIDKLEVGESRYDGAAYIYTRIW
jgi:hypothetical protein